MSNLKHKSLCEVYADRYDSFNKKLVRLADLENGRLNAVSEVEKRWIFTSFKNDDREVGSVGVWEWEETSQVVSSGNPYIKSNATDLTPVEVLFSNTTRTFEDLVDFLTNEGFFYSCNCKPNTPILFVLKDGGSGLLFQSCDLSLTESKLHVLKNVYSAELYDRVDNSMIVKTTTESGSFRYFLRDLYRRSQKKYPLNLQGVIAEEVSWRLKQRVKPKELQVLKDLLRKCPAYDIERCVARKTGVDAESVSKAVDEFRCNIPFICNPEDFGLIEVVLENCPKLLEKCQNQVENQWRRDCQEEIDDHKRQISELSEEVKTKEKNVADLETRKNGLKEECQKLETVEVQCRMQIDALITDFQENAGGLLAKFSVFNLFEKLSLGTKTTTIDNTDCGYATKKLFVPGGSSDKREITDGEYTDYYDVCCDLDDAFLNLIDKKDNIAFILGAFLCACYCRKQSLLLVGPGGAQIMDLFSLVVCRKTADVLNCDGEWDQSAVDAAFANSDDILVVKNPFNGAWFERLILEISNHSKMVVLLSPFAADLRLEPEGLYDYVVPFVTDRVVKPNFKKTVDQVKAKTFSEDFTDLEITDELHEMTNNDAEALGFRRVVCHNVSTLVNDVINILGLKVPEIDVVSVMFGLYPYAVLTGKEELFKQLIQTKQGTILELFPDVK